MAQAIGQTLEATGTSVSSLTFASWTPSANEFLMLVVETRSTTATHDSITSGLSWTKAHDQVGSTSMRQSVWWAQSGASPPTEAVQINFSASVLGAAGQLMRISEVDTAGQPEASTSGTALSAAPSATLTTVTNDAMVLGAFGTRASTNVYTNEGTETANVLNTQGGSSGDAVRMSTQSFIQATAGSATADGTTTESKQWTAVALALEHLPPAATGGFMTTNRGYWGA